MAKVLVTKSSLQSIASAIRAKNGESTTYKPGQMAQAILDLPSGGSGRTVNVSGDTTVETSNGAATLLANTYYLFSTVYDGSSFTNATAIYGSTSPVYTDQGLGRVFCVIKTTATNVSYGRSGELDDARYAPVIFSENGQAVSDVFLSGSQFSTTTQTFEAVSGALYIFVASAEDTDAAGSFTGATIIAHAWCGVSGRKYAHGYIVLATSTSVSYSSSGSHYYALIGAYMLGQLTNT